MNYEELLYLLTTSERYRVKISQGIVKVKTMTIEDEKKGKRTGGGKRERKSKSDTIRHALGHTDLFHMSSFKMGNIPASNFRYATHR